jgi:hypothetical protein
MADELRTFTRDGETRTAGTAVEAVQLRYDGWRERKPKAPTKATKATGGKAPAKATKATAKQQATTVTPPAPDLSGGAE